MCNDENEREDGDFYFALLFLFARCAHDDDDEDEDEDDTGTDKSRISFSRISSSLIISIAGGLIPKKSLPQACERATWTRIS